MKVIDAARIKAVFGKNKLLLLALAAGIVLLLLPIGGGKAEPAQGSCEAPGFSLARQEERLSAQLSRIRGAGRVSVLLSVSGSGERILAQSGEETLVISSGSGSGERVVELDYVNPEYTGAVVVCDGAARAEVRLAIIEAVQKFTQLGADDVLVIQMEE